MNPASVGIVLLAISAVIAPPSGARPPDDFPEPYDSERDAEGPMPAEEAAGSLRLPPGFRATVFASEPEVRNPIGMAWDARGRLWVAENFTYAEHGTQADLSLRDRVLIFEDADGDGRSDRRSVFTDEVQRLTGLEVGHGGVWLSCPPQILFIPDRDGDDLPDGPPEVVLDGFAIPAENYHTVVNGLRWGPDGWLYGRCGASSPGQVGPPGAPPESRVPIRGGLWRVHPTRRTFEVLSHGTTNPWGHDWDEAGNAFFINTVNGHLWHAIPGAHFVRSHTIDPNPRVYELIDQHADHVHWDTGSKIAYSDGLSRAEDDRWGGGHAHSGLTIYSAETWPAPYRGALMTLNFHGRRVNVDRLERAGSGYVGRHAPDLLTSSDRYFRGIDLAYGPDGNVLVLDWSDTGECHEFNGVHRSSGRIFKISYGTSRDGAPGDLAHLDDLGLAALHEHPNAWFIRQARRLLAERSATGARPDTAVDHLNGLVDRSEDPKVRLRALWTLFSMGALDEPSLIGLLDDDHEAVRAAAIRMATDADPIDDVLSHRAVEGRRAPTLQMNAFIRTARRDPSGLVRLALASALHRLPVDQRGALAAPLLSRPEDADDPNLPLLIWYGLIPVADADPEALANLGIGCRLPTTRRLIARRLAEDLEAEPGPLDRLLGAAASADDLAFARDILDGIAEGLRGRRRVARPGSWDVAASRWGGSEDQGLRTRVRDLSVLFGDGIALEEIRRLALDEAADLEARRAALRTLIESRPPDLKDICERLLPVRFLNSTAVRGLALIDDPEVGISLAANYRAFHPSERPAVIETLASRPAFAHALLDRMAGGRIPRHDLPAFLARQIRSFDDPELDRKLAEAWGTIRDSDAERHALIARLRADLTPSAIADADLGRGRALFDRDCGGCHRLFGRGESIGPDLTGAGRDDLDYLLENIVDPSARVDADYRVSILALSDGRLLNGVARERNEQTISLRTPQEELVIDRDLIEAIRPSAASLMPEGLLDPLTDDEIRDLIAYLMQRTSPLVRSDSPTTGEALDRAEPPPN